MANFKSKTFKIINNLNHDVSSTNIKHQPNSTMPGREVTVVHPPEIDIPHVYSVGHGRSGT